MCKKEEHKAKAKYKDMKVKESPSFKSGSLTDMIQEMVDNGYVFDTLETNSGWIEIHTFEDYKHATSMVV